MLFTLVPLVFAGAPADFQSGVEGQWGFGPPVVSEDGRHVALTRWNKAGLWTWDRSTGAVVTVSDARGAGFRPAWSDDTLYFKAVDEGGQSAVRWRDGVSVELDRGRRVGQPLPLGAHPVWSRGGALRSHDGVRSTVRGGAVDADLIEPSPQGEHLAWHDPAGRLHVQDLATGRTTRLFEEGGASHPRWSDDGSRLTEVTADELRVIDLVSGRVLRLPGRDPAWVPGTHEVLFTRLETGADLGPDAQSHTSPYVVLSSTLWALDTDSGEVTPVLDDDAVHARFPTPIGTTGELLFVDTKTGALWRLAGDRRTLEMEPPTATAPPPPPSTARVEVSVPYMHQLWDTPDEFDGGWSCGPTSLIQTMQKWSVLPDWDITASWPYAHTSHWGNYVPYTYTFAGYTYDYTGVAASSNCQGAHGFVCREYGGAVWSYMILYLQQHGLYSDYAGTDYNTLVSEVNAGWPMVASVSVLGYGHIISVRGYVTEDGSPIHTIVVNDPYGDAGTGDWGNYDGEDIVYDWPGYNNGNLEIELSELFYAHGTAPPAEEEEESPPDPVDTGTVDTAEAVTDDPSDEPAPPDDGPRAGEVPGERVAMDAGGCQTARGGAGLGALLGALLLGRRRRRSAHPPGVAGARTQQAG